MVKSAILSLPETIPPMIQAESMVDGYVSMATHLGQQRLLRGAMALAMAAAGLYPSHVSSSPSPAEACAAAGIEWESHGPVMETAPRPMPGFSCSDIFNTDISLSQVDAGPLRTIRTASVTTCSDGERLAARQLFDFVRSTWHASEDEAKYTIYNCRAIEGTDRMSLHSDGRAFDVGLNADVPTQKMHGDQLFAWAIQNADILGIQEVIWNGMIWTPDGGLAEYDGEDPHTDHVHVGLTPEGGNGELSIYQLGLLEARLSESAKG
jgi:hypothetical protein